MSLYSMMKNAKHHSFEEILTRQHEIGGANLLKPTTTGYKSSLEQKHLTFLRRFYDYTHTNTDNFQTTWSTYNQRKVNNKQRDK